MAGREWRPLRPDRPPRARRRGSASRPGRSGRCWPAAARPPRAAGSVAVPPSSRTRCRHPEGAQHFCHPLACSWIKGASRSSRMRCRRPKAAQPLCHPLACNWISGTSRSSHMRCCRPARAQHWRHPLRVVPYKCDAIQCFWITLSEFCGLQHAVASTCCWRRLSGRLCPALVRGRPKQRAATSLVKQGSGRSET